MKKSAEIVFYIVLLYILIAGGWWSFLLHSKNKEAMETKLENIILHLQKNGIENYKQQPEYIEKMAYYSRQRWMIIGESAVFLFLLFLGTWRIFKINQKQLALAKQQQNFLLSITHELKSPLASVQLVLETLQRRRQLAIEQTQKLTERGLIENERLHKLVQDLLLAARVEGGYEYSFENIVLQDLIQECIEWIKHRYKGEIVYDKNTPTLVLDRGDYTTLSSAISNLLDNAIKYAPNSDKIEVSLYQKRQYAVLEIKDQGAGIRKSDRNKIFDKFYRLGEENTRKTKGTGLGLYIVKKVVEAHNGYIQIKDNLPNGSIFMVYLPLTVPNYNFRIRSSKKQLLYEDSTGRR